MDSIKLHKRKAKAFGNENIFRFENDSLNKILKAKKLPLRKGERKNIQKNYPIFEKQKLTQTEETFSSDTAKSFFEKLNLVPASNKSRSENFIDQFNDIAGQREKSKLLISHKPDINISLVQQMNFIKNSANFVAVPYKDRK